MSDLKIVPLRTSLTEHQSQVIGYLEGFLERARAGEFTSASFVFTNTKGEVLTAYTPCLDQHARLGGVSRLMHRLNLSADELGRPD